MSIDESFTDLLHRQMPLARSLDLSAVTATADEVVVQAAWDGRWCTTGGVLHGGYLMALADATGAVCAALNLPGHTATTTIESKTNLLRSVRSGTVTATATPVHVGRTTMVIQTDITRDDGAHAVRTTQTQAVIPLPADCSERDRPTGASPERRLRPWPGSSAPPTPRRLDT